MSFNYLFYYNFLYNLYDKSIDSKTNNHSINTSDNKETKKVQNKLEIDQETQQIFKKMVQDLVLATPVKNLNLLKNQEIKEVKKDITESTESIVQNLSFHNSTIVKIIQNINYLLKNDTLDLLETIKKLMLEPPYLFGLKVIKELAITDEHR